MEDLTFLFGLAGGLLPDAIRIVNNRYNPTLPEYLKSANFYIGTTLLVGLGGAAAWLTQADSVVDALAMGYSAPQIISTLMQQKANTAVPGAVPVSPILEEEGGVKARGNFMDAAPKGITTVASKPGIRNWWGM